MANRKYNRKYDNPILLESQIGKLNNSTRRANPFEPCWQNTCATKHGFVKTYAPRTFGIPLLYMPNNNLTTDLKRVYNVVGNFELCRLAQKGKKAKRQKGKKGRQTQANAGGKKAGKKQNETITITTTKTKNAER